MTLADACHDNVLAIVEARERGDRGLVIESVRELIESVDWYAQADHPLRYCTHAGSEIDALRRAAQRVIERPDDEDALLWLLVLADCVQVFHDSDDEIDVWCALHRRAREDLDAGRCPKCGTEDGARRIQLRRRGA